MADDAGADRPSDEEWAPPVAAKGVAQQASVLDAILFWAASNNGLVANELLLNAGFVNGCKSYFSLLKHLTLLTCLGDMIDMDSAVVVVDVFVLPLSFWFESLVPSIWNCLAVVVLLLR